MNGFDAAWLREHQTRMAACKPPPAASFVSANSVAFTLPRPTILLNVLIRMSWPKRYKHAKALSTEIAMLVPHDPRRQPFERASVLIRRMSTGVPDHFAVAGGVKILVDTLLVRSDTHPHGLGFCLEDDPAHMTLTVECERVEKRADQRTIVLIERVG